MPIELKPCPFCGGEAHIVIRHNEDLSWVRYYVACRRCDTRTGRRKTSELVSKAWNRRVDNGNS